MTWPQIALLGAAALAAVAVLTWLLEPLVPAPFSGYLAAVAVGLAVTEIVKRQPRQRALRLFAAYLRARERGADEAAARARLLARAARDEEARRRAAAAWVGASEKERVVGGVAALLHRHGRPLDLQVLDAAYDRVRDRVLIPGWEALPQAFVDALRRRLGEAQRAELDRLAESYPLFQQRFFRDAAALGQAPEEGVADFARLLASLGNRVAGEHPGDAERAYRLSLALRPELNLAHAGLALVLARTGRAAEAAREAQRALEVLDAYERRAPTEAPSTEDVPYRSPLRLRQVLERLGRGEPPPAPAEESGASARRERLRRILWVVSLVLILFSATLWLLLRGAEWGPGAAP